MGSSGKNSENLVPSYIYSVKLTKFESKGFELLRIKAVEIGSWTPGIPARRIKK